MMRTSTWGYRMTLLSTLGLAPATGCGGSVDDRPVSNAGTGGGNGNGGASTGGASTGGRPPGGFLPCESAPGGDTRHTGYETCGSNLHRTAKVDCSAPPREPDYRCTVPANAEAARVDCAVDADCTEKPNGSCTAFSVQIHSCMCVYGCVSDADCNAGEICVCGERHGECTPASCTVDSDCEPGALCLTQEGHGSLVCGRAFACQTREDRCSERKDCGTGELCAVVDGARKCVPDRCPTPGRPFLVGGEARVAKVVRREDWCSSLAPDVAALSAADRAALCEHWTHAALMEHASIAAFARFALELTSLGAPALLVAETHAAMADETLHARDAFALASAYGGVPVGPGAFEAATGSLSGRTAADIVRTTILEGCIGETVAAVEAAEALARATDPAVREALTRVAEDEARHAELAWRFVQWAMSEGKVDLRRAALDGLAAIVASEMAIAGETPARSAFSDGRIAHGVLDEATRGEVRRRVLADVIAPCAAALRAAHDSVILRNGIVTTKTAPFGRLSST